MRRSTCTEKASKIVVLHLLVFWMSARMDDTIHIQIQIVKLHIIWIGFADVYWNLDSINLLRLKETYSYRTELL